MKRKDLERELIELGWYFKRRGGNHDIWTNGEDSEPIPRHNELDDYLAKKILKKANRLKREKGEK